MADEILTTTDMAAADRHAIAHGVSGEALMEAAGEAMARAIAARWSARPVLALCGPGNNGGDGFVAARRLAERGWPVRVAAMAPVKELSGDARTAALAWSGPVETLDADAIPGAGLVIDALFGAGLSRPLERAPAACAQACASFRAQGGVVVSADIPSGVHGDQARSNGPAFTADLTVTFHRYKPGHVLQPGRTACGELVLADIGIPETWRDDARACASLNAPDAWTLPGASAHDHKHARGRLGVLAGPAGKTGAARLAGQAGLIGGAGLVTLLAPGSSYLEAAIASPAALMTAKLSAPGAFADDLDARRADAAVIGPGAGADEALRERVLSALERGGALVLDADVFTAFADTPEAFFDALHERCVLTPHQGEFDRLFPGLREQAGNKIEAARTAARTSGAVVVFKGPDTVIAAPEGEVSVNVHADPALATAGTGDGLAGLTGAFLARGLDAFDAARAAVWIHGEAGRRMGEGATAHDLLDRLPGALQAAHDHARRAAALSRLTQG